MNHRSHMGLPALVAAFALLVASCSSDSADSTTTTEDRFSEITYSSPGLGIGVFNGVSCDLDGDLKGTINGEDETGGTIVIVLEGDTGTISINDASLQVADAPVTSVEDPEQFALDVAAASVPVLVSVVYSEWPACSS
jgi:hypothetical protein